MTCPHTRKVPQRTALTVNVSPSEADDSKLSSSLTIEGEAHVVCADCGRQVEYGPPTSRRAQSERDPRRADGSSDSTFLDIRHNLPA